VVRDADPARIQTIKAWLAEEIGLIPKDDYWVSPWNQNRRGHAAARPFTLVEHQDSAADSESF
jgi:hypothetical protein